MAGKVGEAFVEIVADYKAFAQKAERELNVLLKRMAGKADFGPMKEAAGDSGQESGTEYVRQFESTVYRSSSRSRLRRMGERIGRLFSRSVGDGADRDRRGSILTRMFGEDGGGKDRNSLQKLFSGLGGGIAGALGGAFSLLSSGASSAIGALGSLSTSILTFLAIAALIGPLVYVAVGALISLSGLLFLLPAGMAAAGVAVGVLMIAFTGFGEAISAVASGDMKKFDEALKGLSPSARAVARDFKDLWPLLQKVKDVVQEAFFKPLVGDLDKLGNTLLPKITPGLERIGTLLGNMASTLIEKMSSPEGIKFFETTLKTIGDIIENSGPGLEKFFKGLGDFFITSLPFAEDFFKAVTDGLGTFGEFLSEKDTKEGFKQFLTDSLETGKEFMGVLKELIGLFKAMFEDTDEGGKKFLKDIKDALKALKEFFQSKDGKEALNLMIDLAKLFGGWLLAAAKNAGKLYRTVKDLWHAAKDAYHALEKLFNKAGEAASPTIAAGLRLLGNFPFFAEGGIITKPTVGMIGEAGPEVVVPLSKPDRARQLMKESGLVDLAAGMGGGGGDTQVVVYLGTEQITDILDQRVVKGFRAQGRRLAQGVREG